MTLPKAQPPPQIVHGGQSPVVRDETVLVDGVAVARPNGVCRLIGLVTGELAEKLKKSMYRRPEINPLIIGTTLEREKIRENIKKRLQERIDAGMIEEVDGLHARGFSWERLEKLGLEYRFCALFLQGKISREELFEQLFIAIRQFAKRQETWFRFMEKNGVKINWLPSVPDKETRINAAVELVQKEMNFA